MSGSRMAGERLPAIARKAKAHGCEIQWADETGLSSRANDSRSCAPEGTPRSSADRAALFAVDDFQPDRSGQAAFMIYEGAIKAPIFLNFLQRLVREAARSCS